MKDKHAFRGQLPNKETRQSVNFALQVLLHFDYFEQNLARMLWIEYIRVWS